MDPPKEDAGSVEWTDYMDILQTENTSIFKSLFFIGENLPKSEIQN
jgi:hypothetical protein